MSTSTCLEQVERDKVDDGRMDVIGQIDREPIRILVKPHQYLFLMRKKKYCRFYYLILLPNLFSYS